MEEIIGLVSQAEQLGLFLVFPLPTQITERRLVIMEQSLKQQMEEITGLVRQGEQLMIFLEYPLPMQITEQLLDLIAIFKWEQS